MNAISSSPSHQPLASADEKVVRRALGHYVIGLASRRCASNPVAGIISQAGSNYISTSDRWVGIRYDSDISNDLTVSRSFDDFSY